MYPISPTSSVSVGSLLANRLSNPGVSCVPFAEASSVLPSICFGLTGLRLDLDQYKTVDIEICMSFR
jgi:hypothetical protein